jgi:hypothetical protein
MAIGFQEFDVQFRAQIAKMSDVELINLGSLPSQLVLPADRSAKEEHVRHSA